MRDQTTDTALANLTINHDEILEKLAPYISENLAADSAEGKFRMRQRVKNLVHMILRFYIGQLRQGQREKTGKLTHNLYESNYSTAEFTGYRNAGRPVTYLFNDRVLQMVGMGNYRSKSLVLEKILETIQPKEVAEVGCGMGRHVAYMAHRFHAIHFNGIDFSASAIDLCRRVQQQDEIDLQLPEAPGPVSGKDRDAIRTASYQTGDARNLDHVADNSFDLVYTVSALEQMAAILPEALSEIRRVTKEYVVFFEPFLDGNDFLGRRFLHAGNYFRARYAEIEAAGFEILTVLDCIPLKPSFKDTVVIARVK